VWALSWSFDPEKLTVEGVSPEQQRLIEAAASEQQRLNPTQRKWDQHGLGFRWRDWLVASWGLTSEEVGVAAYKLDSKEWNGGIYASTIASADTSDPVMIHSENLWDK